MKLSTKSRYGTRLMLDMSQHYGKGPIQLGEIAKRQDISVKYLEQIIRPLKKANYIRSFRGAKGGHVLTKAPSEITVGEIVALLEGGKDLTKCIDDPSLCERADDCPTRMVWQEATKAMYAKLDKVRFSELAEIKSDDRQQKYIQLLTSG